MNIKKRLFICILLSYVILFIFNCSPDNSTRLILATATTGGTYYPVGVAISTLTSTRLEETDNITMTSITSAGSGENIQLLQEHEADLAILQGLYGAMAWQGKGVYEDKPMDFIRSVSMLWENVEHFVVLSEYVTSGNISDMKNLKTENFSIGKRGSGTEISGREILLSAGFDPDRDFSLQYLGYTPSASALQDGRIAGMNIPAGPPASSIIQAFAAIGENRIRILEFTDAQIESVNSRFPVWHRYTIQKGTYPGQQTDINTISQSNLLVVHKDLSEQTVYKIVKNIYENLQYLNEIHGATKEMALNRAVLGLTVPLHPGAVRYYTEAGLEIPSHLLPR